MLQRVVGAAGLAVALVLVPAVAGADMEWNQEQATAAAKEFQASVQGIRQELRQGMTGQNIASMQSRAYYRLKDSLRLIESEARELAGDLEAGQGQAETLPIYRRLRHLIRSARDDARRIYQSDPLQKRIEKARVALQKLAAYYPAEPERGPGGKKPGPPGTAPEAGQDG